MYDLGFRFLFFLSVQGIVCSMRAYIAGHVILLGSDGDRAEQRLEVDG